MKINLPRVIATAAIGTLAVGCLAYGWHQSSSIAEHSAHKADRQSLTVKPVSQVKPADVTPSAFTTDNLTDEQVSYLLAVTLPYYRVDAPKWCQEDMVCWDASNADGRTDREVFADLRCDIVISSLSYGSGVDTPATAAEEVCGL